MNPMPSIDPLEDPRWDALLPSFSGASFFHTSAWARALHGTYGYTPTYFVENQEGIKAVLPVMEVNSWLTGRRGITLPFTDECDVLSSEADGSHRLFKQLLSYSQQRRWKYYELRGGSTIGEGSKPSVSFYGHRLGLKEPATLFAKFDSAVRRAIRKAEHESVGVEFATDQDSLRAFYRLLCKTRGRHGMPPQPFSFFDNIHRHILSPGKGCVVTAKSKGVPVAGAVFFHFGETLLYKFAASDDAAQHLRGNNLVLWKAIEHYSRKGYTSLDFGRTSLSNAGLRRFKLSWGSEERRIDYLRYSQRDHSFVTSTDQSSDRWHTRFFRAIPSGLSRLIGAATYKHLA